MKKYLTSAALKYCLLAYVVYAISWRCFLAYAGDTYLFILVAMTIILSVVAVVSLFYKFFTPLLAVIATVVGIRYIPFELIKSRVAFTFEGGYRHRILQELDEGKYDSLLWSEPYSQDGEWVPHSYPRFKIYKRGTLQMIFIYQGEIEAGGSQFYGLLYISDRARIDNYEIKDFFPIMNRVYFGDKWYYVDNAYEEYSDF